MCSRHICNVSSGSTQFCFEYFGDPESIGINSPGIRDATASGHKAAVGNIQIVDIMGTAVGIKHRLFRVMSETATSGNQVRGGVTKLNKVPVAATKVKRANVVATKLNKVPVATIKAKKVSVAALVAESQYFYMGSYTRFEAGLAGSVSILITC